MMALPSSLNPILSIHLPIILSLPATAPTTPPPSLVSPPTSPNVSEHYGTSQPSLFDQRNAVLSPQSSHSLQASVEALRLSLLGVAAIHQSYLLSKSGPENRERAQDMWDLAGHLRVQASRCLGEAVVTMEGCRSDAALGACVSIALIDVSLGLALNKRSMLNKDSFTRYLRGVTITSRTWSWLRPSLNSEEDLEPSCAMLRHLWRVMP